MLRRWDDWWKLLVIVSYGMNFLKKIGPDEGHTCIVDVPHGPLRRSIDRVRRLGLARLTTGQGDGQQDFFELERVMDNWCE
jgi:hypothetical protein